MPKEESEWHNVKKILASLTVIAALLLSGCAQVGAAATVGDVKITQATVQASIDSVMAARASVDITAMQLESGETLNRAQLRFHLLSYLLLQTAKELKLEVTKAEIDTRRVSILEQVGGEGELPSALVGAQIAPKNLDQYIEAIIISEKLSQALVSSGVGQESLGLEIQKLIVAKAAQLKVSVNPRYGIWDAASADVVASDSAGTAVTPPTK